MLDFRYEAAESVEQVVRLLQESNGEAMVLAGGTDMIPQLREHARRASLVVDIKKIPELMGIQFDPTNGMRLGAAAPCYKIYSDQKIAAAYGALADSTRILGGWQIQSRASVGGNLCNASPAADSIPALIVCHAICHIARPSGQRTLPVDQFCIGVGKSALEQGELLVALELPPPAAREASAYQRFIPRNEMDIAVAGAGCSVVLDESGRTISSARIALSAVAPTPVAALEAQSWLAGKPATAETFATAGEMAKQVASPISDRRGTAEYRRHLVGVLVKRTLAVAVERANSQSKGV